MGLLRRLFSFSEREVARYGRTVSAINALEPEFQSMAERQFATHTSELRDQLAAGADLDELLPRAFAAAREAARRVLGERPFDVQMIGAITLHEGRIAEMKTGEGKTLTATMPLYLNALAGRGAHLITTNDYLVKWQAEWMGPVYGLLGLTTGSIQHDMTPGERARAYACDVTYARNSEVGFDYLRDNMASDRSELVLRDLHYAIVDEVDSILIDEARTPLIISGIPAEATDLYQKADAAVRGLVPSDAPAGETPNGDYVVDEKLFAVHFTDEGIAKVEAALGVSNLADPAVLELQHHVRAALQAHALYHRDDEYVVKDDEVIIVDEYTGHIQPGRRYSHGIHEAIEAKEGVPIRREHQTMATITYQNLFRLYDKLAGMTGTAKSEEGEFQQLYNMPVIAIPTNRPVIRQDLPDVVYATMEAKLRAITVDIARRKTRRQPMLVGTRSVATSERVAGRLTSGKLRLLGLVSLVEHELGARRGVPDGDRERWQEALRRPLDQPLSPSPDVPVEADGVEADEEVSVPSAAAGPVLTAGEVREIAQALDLEDDVLAPRNLERLLAVWGISRDGDDPRERRELQERLARLLADELALEPLNAKHHEREAEIIRQAGCAGAVTIATNMAGRGVDIKLGGEPEDGSDRTATHDEVAALGGLHVIGTERHDSRRIDDQLRGRSGRQGDPGSSQFYASMEDELVRVYCPERAARVPSEWLQEDPLPRKVVGDTLELAQEKVGVRNFGWRKQTLQYDNVMNEQRRVIYRDRRRVLMGEDVGETVREMLDRLTRRRIEAHVDVDGDPEGWDFGGLAEALDQVVPGLGPYLNAEQSGWRSIGDLAEDVRDQAQTLYAEHRTAVGEEEMAEVERVALLAAIDASWPGHLQAMDALREAVHLRAWGGLDPLVQYQKEGYDYFQQLLDHVAEDVIRMLLAYSPEADADLGAE